MLLVAEQSLQSRTILPKVKTQPCRGSEEFLAALLLGHVTSWELWFCVLSITSQKHEGKTSTHRGMNLGVSSVLFLATLKPKNVKNGIFQGLKVNNNNNNNKS